MFREHTPDAAAFEAYVEKISVLNNNDQNISDDELRSISAKAMVIVGDADDVRPEHALAMFKLLRDRDEGAAGVSQGVPAARLAILPATSHVAIWGQSDVLAPMVTAFLDDESPVTPELF